jgi:hypothetical protein
MAAIKISERETDAFNLNTDGQNPDMLKVNIETGTILTDRRNECIMTYLEVSNGRSVNRYRKEI